MGWELYIPIEKSKIIYEIIVEAGKKHSLVHAGRLSMDIMRMEKGYLHWSHDITPAENPFEAGLNFAVKINKESDFLGKESLIASKPKPKKQFAMFCLENSKPGEPLLLHDEPIYFNGKIVGETTSGNFSFCYNVNMAFGYIDSTINIDNAKNEYFEIEVAKIKYKAKLQIEPLHDPKNINIKS